MSEMLELSFGQFASLARRRGWTKDYLLEVSDRDFGQKYDYKTGRWVKNSAYVEDFWDRVLHGKHAENVIPYRSVIEFYQRHLVFEIKPDQARCWCGCGQPVFGAAKYASPTCREAKTNIRTPVKMKTRTIPRAKV